MKKLIFIISAFLFISCSEEDIVKPKEILVIGNSITQSPPIGEWTGNWGMAASAPDKDFCSLISKNLDRKNIAVWENNFNCSVEHYYFVTSKHYDYIIFKIGENVSDVSNFKDALIDLTEYYSNYTNKIILVTTVWSEYVFDENNTPYEVPSQKDRIIKEVAFEKGYILVDISEMKNNNSMFAWDEYPNNGAIGSHPNDKGMEFIANKIKEKL